MDYAKTDIQTVVLNIILDFKMSEQNFPSGYLTGTNKGILVKIKCICVFLFNVYSVHLSVIQLLVIFLPLNKTPALLGLSPRLFFNRTGPANLQSDNLSVDKDWPEQTCK